jgi:hypothetical protein
MRPATLERLQRIIEDAAEDLLGEHQAEMSRAWQELQATTSIDQRVGAAYFQGCREERLRCVEIIRREQRTITRNTIGWNRLGSIIRTIDPEASHA